MPGMRGPCASHRARRAPLRPFPARTMPMNTQPSDLIRQTQALSADVTKPISGSRKIHVHGSREDIRVPMREVELTQTPKIFGAEINPPFAVYDTSGAYTDAN